MEEGEKLLMRNYDDWKLSCGLENEFIVSYCEYCSGELYDGEEAYYTIDGWVHEDCFRDYAEQALDARKMTVQEREDW